MKKIYLSSLLFFGCLISLSAQDKIGIKAGINLATEYIRMGNQSATTKIAPLFHVTAYYDAAISPGFSIQPGFSLQGKGGLTRDNGEKFTDKLLYLEVPVNFIARIATRDGDFFFGGGPYFAYGVDARITSGGRAVHLEWGSGPEQLRPFDAGLSALLGYRFSSGFTINLSSSAGMVNMSNQGEMKYLNRVTSFGVGYEFSASR